MLRKISLLPNDDDTCGWVRVLPPRKEVRRVLGTMSFDWAVVGAGYTGLAAARRLAEQFPEQSIALIDAQRAGEGAAGRNSGFAVDVSPSPQRTIVSAEATYGRAYRLNMAGLESLRRLVNKHAIDCDWREGGKYNCAAEERHVSKVQLFATHLAELGIPYELCDAAELQRRFGTRHYKAGIRTEQSVLVQPAALTRGLALNLPEGVTLLEESPVLAMEHNGRIRLTCPSGTVTAGKLILATSAFLPQFGFFQNRILPVVATAALTRPLTEQEHQRIGAPQPWGVVSIHRFGATVRYTSDRRILIRNTLEYWPRLSMTRDELYARRPLMERSFRARFPDIADVPFEYYWAGVISTNRNFSSAFGRVAENVFAAGGCNGGGIARCTALGTAIGDQAAGATSAVLSDALSLPEPAAVPPRPILDLAMQVEIARRRQGVGAEF